MAKYSCNSAHCFIDCLAHEGDENRLLDIFFQSVPLFAAPPQQSFGAHPQLDAPPEPAVCRGFGVLPDDHRRGEYLLPRDAPVVLSGQSSRLT